MCAVTAGATPRPAMIDGVPRSWSCRISVSAPCRESEIREQAAEAAGKRYSVARSLLARGKLTVDVLEDYLGRESALGLPRWTGDPPPRRRRNTLPRT